MSSSMSKHPILTEEQLAQLRGGDAIEYKDSRYPNSSFLLKIFNQEADLTLAYFQLPQGFKLPSELESELRDLLQIKQTIDVGGQMRLKNSGIMQGEFRTTLFNEQQAKEALDHVTVPALSIDIKSSAVSSPAAMFTEKKRFFGFFSKKNTSTSQTTTPTTGASTNKEENPKNPKVGH